MGQWTSKQGPIKKTPNIREVAACGHLYPPQKRFFFFLLPWSLLSDFILFMFHPESYSLSSYYNSCCARLICLQLWCLANCDTADVAELSWHIYDGLGPYKYYLCFWVSDEQLTMNALPCPGASAASFVFPYVYILFPL